MRKFRSVVLAAVAAWLMVVGVGSTAVWLVISKAGDDVGAPHRLPIRAAVTDAGPLTPQAQPAQPVAPSPPPLHPAPSRPTAHPSARHHASHAPSPSATPAPPPPAAPAAPVARRRTWEGEGGYVTAQCRGADVGLVAAEPDAGFVITVTDRGPQTLAASFAGRERERGRHTDVQAACVGGVPRFESHTWLSHDE